MFPIYAVEGWSAQICGSGSRNDELTALRIAHTETQDADLLDERPRIEVTTSTGEPYHDELAIARQKLEQWVHDEIDHRHSPDLSNAAITLPVSRRRSPPPRSPPPAPTPRSRSTSPQRRSWSSPPPALAGSRSAATTTSRS
jgi:hypothetical protein